MTEGRKATQVSRRGGFRRITNHICKVEHFTSTSVLISGESGTGKELIARAVQFGGPLLEGPFVPVNCSAILRELAESMFFGRVRGAFSPATTDHKGHFEQAHEGTLFPDEIGDMPRGDAGKLLRVLEDGLSVPVGAAKKRMSRSACWPAPTSICRRTSKPESSARTFTFG